MAINKDVQTHLALLHDAVLVSIQMSWAEGRVVIDVRTHVGAQQVIIEESTGLICPREFSWGRSECINEIRVNSLPGSTGLKLEIEMQSGDVLTICGALVDFK